MTTKQKADYVRNAPQSRPHICHWPNCGKQVPPAMWGCKQHWFTLPQRLRSKIWSTYRPGQEINLSPSQSYVLVAREVQQWIEKDNVDD